jgi:hypothetical protein
MRIKLRRYRVNELRRGLRAQSVIEYSMIIACVVAALLAMQIYTKRGIEGRLKQASDEISQQYAPTGTTSTITTSVDSKITQNSKHVPLTYPPGHPQAGQDVKDDYGLPVYGIKTTTTIDHETTERSGSEELGEFEATLF